MPIGQPPKSNAGTWAAVLGGLAVVGGVAAAAVAGGAKKPLGAARAPGRVRAFSKKPCGCGR